MFDYTCVRSRSVTSNMCSKLTIEMRDYVCTRAKSQSSNTCANNNY